MFKSIFIPSKFIRRKEFITKKIPTGDTKRGLLGVKKTIYREEGEWIDTGSASDCVIDGEQLAIDIDKAIKEYTDEGYEVVSMQPITNGNYQADYDIRTIDNKGMPFSVGGYGYGYGFSYTSGMLITFTKS